MVEGKNVKKDEGQDSSREGTFFFFLVFLLFPGLLPRHMEVSRLGVESEL